MKTLRIFLIAILFISATAAGLITQFIIGINTTVLNSGYYITQMEKHNLYNIPQNYLFLKIKENSYEKLPEPVYNGLLEPAVRNTFSSTWIQDQTNRLVVNSLDYLTNKNETLDLKVDFKNRKQILAYELSNQLENLSQNLQVYKITAADKESFINGLITIIGLPDSVDLGEIINTTYPELKNAVDKYRVYYSYTNYLPYAVYILIFILILLITKVSSGLRLFGKSMLLAGALLILLVSGTNIWVNNIFIENISKYDILFTATATNPLIVVAIFKNSVIGNFNKIGVIFCGSGALLILLSYYINKIIIFRASSRYHKEI